MSKRYEDWADWAGDHPEEAEAQLKAEYTYLGCPGHGHNKDIFHADPTKCPENTCPHAEVDTQGVCEGCGIEVPGWEPDDAQLLMQSGTKEPGVSARDEAVGEARRKWLADGGTEDEWQEMVAMSLPCQSISMARKPTA